jgi:hypothetical protein
MADFAGALRSAIGLQGTSELATTTRPGLAPVALPPAPGGRRRLQRFLLRAGAAPWAVRVRVWLLVLLLAVAIGLAAGWWLFERAAASGEAEAADLALELRALEAVLLQEGQRLLQDGDPQGALTVAALVERLSPRSEAGRELRGSAEALAQQVGVPAEDLQQVEQRAADPVRAARQVLGDSRQAVEVSAALARLTEARELQAAHTPSATILELELRSEAPRGSVVIYASGKQVYRRKFSFSERHGVFVRRGVPGELRETVELPPGEHELMVYVTRRQEQARLTRLSTAGAGGEALRLAIQVPESGDPEVRLQGSG